MTPGENPAIIKMKDVSVSVVREPAHAVLEKVNWTVLPGEFWVVAGQQRAGKTDLLMTTQGLIPPLKGDYELFGREMRAYTEADVPDRMRVGFVFANGQMFNHLTVSENVALPLRYHRNLDEAEAEAATRWLLELLELVPLAGHLPGSLSRDWMKRAALARALVLRPEVLLCDDPLAGLGHRHRLWWVRFLDQLRAGHAALGSRPLTLVVTTEDLSPWKDGSRRFALLRDGLFIPLGSWGEVAKAGDPAVQELLAAVQ